MSYKYVQYRTWVKWYAILEAMGKYPPPTVREIAQMTGISKSTVCRYMNAQVGPYRIVPKKEPQVVQPAPPSEYKEGQDEQNSSELRLSEEELLRLDRCRRDALDTGFETDCTPRPKLTVEDSKRRQRRQR